MPPAQSSAGHQRRPGYTPANAAVGRRGQHTRDRIITHAARLFATHGFYGTSIDAIAREVGGSRATVYQYFAGKDEIFVELTRRGEHAVLEHVGRLQGLGPHADGLRSLRRWVRDGAKLYDRYAMVFLEFPGVGHAADLPPTDAAAIAGQYTDLFTQRLQDAGVAGIAPADAAAALLRITHMVNLYRHRRMFELPSATQTSDSLTVAMQLLLFPDTPDEVLTEVVPARVGARLHEVPAAAAVPAQPESDPSTVSPVRQDILAAGSALFAEHGFSDVGMAYIATAAGVSRATLYRHFAGKVEIFSELTSWTAVEGGLLSTELHALAARGVSRQQLKAWLARYVHFHRNYRGVIRSWYDGSLEPGLSETVGQGLRPYRAAALALVARARLPANVDPAVAAAIVLAVLGRMSERPAGSGHETDYDAATLMANVLNRALRLN